MSGKFNSEAFYERLYTYAYDCLELVKILPRLNYNLEYGHQLIKSSSSISANYIEALEAMSRKDIIYRLRVSRKETRESIQWLRLIHDANRSYKKIIEKAEKLIEEANEIKKMFTSSILTSEKSIT